MLWNGVKSDRSSIDDKVNKAVLFTSFILLSHKERWGAHSLFIVFYQTDLFAITN
ncbi:hypothetical protein D068_cds27580 [Bacillus atrophaeus UCMB-5137]|nr:hypothetical protein D068_cds27580 [Bacillus atrophaeus UCMB-5137]